MFNPFEPGFFDDPYPHYAALREQEPVHHSPLGPWMLTRYEDCIRVLRDVTLSVEDANATPQPIDPEMAAIFEGRDERGSRAILNLDPPDHDRLRRLVQKAFTPKTVENLRPEVERLVDEALDTVVARGTGEMDLIADLAFPLPFAVISEMLGMPTERRDDLREWSHALVKTLDPIITVEEAKAAADGSDAMTEHLEQVIAAKRQDPGDDLLSALIAAEDDGDVLDERELLDQVILLYIAGHETTVNLIGNGALALLRHRDQLDRLRADPALAQNAVEELLRFDSPVQFSRRIALPGLRGRRLPHRAGELRAHLPRRSQPRPGALGPDRRRARPRPRRCRPPRLVRQRGPPLPRRRARTGRRARRVRRAHPAASRTSRSPTSPRPGTTASCCGVSTRSR